MRSKEQMKEARKLHKKAPGKLEPVNLNMCGAIIPTGLTRAFRNNRYTVMIYDNSKMTNGITAIMAMIQRHDNKPLNNHWREIQAIKNEVFGKEVTAIEYYPAEADLINDHNIYWIWILPEGILPLRAR